jgi:integrase
VARHRAVLRSALGLAVRDRLIPDNAAALARLRRPTQRRQPPTTDEVRALLAALADHRLRPLILTLAATGLRIGEALGLRWADVDLEAGRLTVRWQLVRAPAEHAAPWVLSEPKTPAARRTIHLAPTVVSTLRAWRASQATELLALGRPRPAHDLVWTSRIGGPLSPSTVDWVLRAACRRAGIRPLSPHDLRRYAATIAASTGDLLAAQALLGHTTPRLTGERYAAATDAALARAAAAAEEVLR